MSKDVGSEATVIFILQVLLTYFRNSVLADVPQFNIYCLFTISINRIGVERKTSPLSSLARHGDLEQFLLQA